MSAFKTITSDNVTVGTTLTFPNRATISNMPTGTANRVLATNVSGIPSYSTLPVASITPGTDQQSFITNVATPSWVSRSWRYGYVKMFPDAQNWNSGATTSITFTGFTGSSTSLGTTPYTNITQLVAGQSLTTGSATTYIMSVQATLTNTDLLSPSTIRFDFLVAGSVIAGSVSPTFTIPANTTQTVYGTSSPFSIPAAQTITFRAARVSGTSVINCDPTNSVITVQVVATSQAS